MPHGDDANTILVLKADNVFRIHAYFKTFYTVKEFKKISERFGISICPNISSIIEFEYIRPNHLARSSSWELSKYYIVAELSWVRCHVIGRSWSVATEKLRSLRSKWLLAVAELLGWEPANKISWRNAKRISVSERNIICFRNFPFKKS